MNPTITTPATPDTAKSGRSVAPADGNLEAEAMECPRLPIGEVIIVTGYRRKLRDIDSLAKSIGESGLLNPITVNERRELIAGMHRLEACKLLGWRTIPVRLVIANDLQSELASLDENLIRNELTDLERSEAMARRKEIYESLHPETRHGGTPGNQHTGKRRTPPLTTRSFVEDTAAKTGRSARTIREDVQIATSLSQPVKDAVRGTALESNRRGLVALAREKDDTKKLAAIQSVNSGRTRNVAEALHEAEIGQERVTQKRPAKSDGTEKQLAARELDEKIREMLMVDCMSIRETAKSLGCPTWRVQYAKKRLGLIRSDENPLRRLVEHAEEFSDAINDAAAVAEAAWWSATPEQVSATVTALSTLSSTVAKTVQRLKKEAGKGSDPK